MNKFSLYTIKNSEGKFFHSGMGGEVFWCDVPDYMNAARDRDQACGWKYNLSKHFKNRNEDCPIEVAEVVLTW